ncbi:hypothetical protein PAERUG_E15_London_28_01_14_08781 [Pseudomonas aeruginosa]|nr:hypothetical protein PAERUG_E15_London_28_01_14_08781 [Pseudomonas aeruginosa]
MRVGGAPGPLANAEVGLEMDIAARVPAGVDAVDDATQVPAGCATRQQVMQPAAFIRGGDLLSVAKADRVQPRGVGDAALQERHLPVEVQFIQVFGRHAQYRRKRVGEQPLVSQVVDGQQGRHGRPVPTHVGGRHGHRPVIQVQQLWRPVQPGTPGRNLRRRMRKRRESNRVVLPLLPLPVHVGRALTLVQLRRQQHVDRKAVGLHRHADRARRQAGPRADLPHPLQLWQALQYLRVAGQQHARITRTAHRTRQGRSDVAQATGLDEVRHLSGNEQHALHQFRQIQRLRMAAAGADRHGRDGRDRNG